MLGRLAPITAAIVAVEDADWVTDRCLDQYAVQLANAAVRICTFVSFAHRPVDEHSTIAAPDAGAMDGIDVDMGGACDLDEALVDIEPNGAAGEDGLADGAETGFVLLEPEGYGFEAWRCPVWRSTGAII
jgi:hypothetical protein